MRQILIIDDDIHIGNMLEEVLQKEGYRTLRAYSGTEAVLLLSSISPDLILLDLMLPGLPGEELLPRIKDIPVIVISAKADLDSRVNLLLDGAADYITKPFEIRELLARITAALRKSAPPSGDILRFDNLCLDTATRTVTLSRKNPGDGIFSDISGKTSGGIPDDTSGVTSDDTSEGVPDDISEGVPDDISEGVSDNISGDDTGNTCHCIPTKVRLTRTEAAILKILMLHPGQVIAKSHLLELISRDTPDCTDNSLKTHISNLRKKLRDIGGREYIEAVWGIGFHLTGEKS